MVGLWVRRPFKREIDALVVVSGVLSRWPLSASKQAHAKFASGKWLISKNSGGGIAPAAIAALIEGRPCSVNAFYPSWGSPIAAVKR
jgi:hypothetical protein